MSECVLKLQKVKQRKSLKKRQDHSDRSEPRQDCFFWLTVKLDKRRVLRDRFRGLAHEEGLLAAVTLVASLIGILRDKAKESKGTCLRKRETWVCSGEIVHGLALS